MVVGGVDSKIETKGPKADYALRPSCYEQPMSDITRLISRAAASGIWSRGVKLAREGAVTLESRNDVEIALRVRSPSRPVAASVSLYITPDEEEWDCDCGSRVMPCEHIAAAAIVVGQDGEPEAGSALPALKTATDAGGQIVYRFIRVDHGMKLQRFVTQPDGEAPLPESLTAMLSRPGLAATLRPDEPDLRADLLLQNRAGGVLPPDTVSALLQILFDLGDASRSRGRIFVDNQPVTIAREIIKPHARVFDRDRDVVLRIEADPRISAVVATGIALCGDVLHLLGEQELTGGWLQNLPREEVFAPTRFGELKTRILPELQKRIVVAVQTDRLPAIVRDLPPRIRFEVTREFDGISVLPLMVYGDPPCARIDDGRLVHLGGTVPVRDTGAEQRLRLRLHEELNLLPGRRSRLAGADAARLAERLQRFADGLAGPGADALRTLGELRPILTLRDDTGTSSAAGARIGVELTFALEVNGETRSVPATEVLSAWWSGQGLMAIGDGFANLPRGFLDKHAEKIEALLAARSRTGHVATHALSTLSSLCDALSHPRPPSLEKLAPLVESFTQIPVARLPADLTAELRGYQRDGVNWLTFMRKAGLGALLADDMGLGKTLQTLCAIHGRTLVVCPTSVLPNWQKEAARFRPGLRVCAYHGNRRTLDPKADVTLTSYAILRLDSEQLQAQAWSTVVLDEAQAIKNPDSQTARAAFDLPGDFRIALSGTPVENRLDELWSIAHFANPGLLASRGSFVERFAAPIAAGDAQVAAKLRQRIKPFLLRRLKKDVAPELPPRIESTLHVELEPSERAVYDAVRAATRADVLRLIDGGKGMMAALEALLRLRQASCHSGLVPGQNAQGSSKITTLVESLETAVAEGHKALVFSQWTSFLDKIEPHFKEAKIPFLRLDGATRDRGEVVDAFSKEDGPPVLLISLKAGGSGLNLAAADHVYLCDPWWNPAVEAQAADRAHRIGQDRPVLINRLVALDTVEERILLLQEKKRAIADAALGTGGGAAGGLTRQDLLDLLA